MKILGNFDPSLGLEITFSLNEMLYSFLIISEICVNDVILNFGEDLTLSDSFVVAGIVSQSFVEVDSFHKFFG